MENRVLISDEELKPFGYAPGGYVLMSCSGCGHESWNLDKRAIHCRNCAEFACLAKMKADLTSAKEEIERLKERAQTRVDGLKKQRDESEDRAEAMRTLLTAERKETERLRERVEQYRHVVAEIAGWNTCVRDVAGLFIKAQQMCRNLQTSIVLQPPQQEE